MLEDAPPPVEDDPFFVGEGPGSSPAPQYRPATVADEFLVEETPVESVAPAEPPPVEPPAAPPLSPEALVAQTIAEPGDDWDAPPLAMAAGGDLRSWDPAVEEWIGGTIRGARP